MSESIIIKLNEPDCPRIEKLLEIENKVFKIIKIDKDGMDSIADADENMKIRLVFKK